MRLAREYRTRYRASGPGGPNCPCCTPRLGQWATAKPKLHRTVRRVSKQRTRQLRYLYDYDG
jgi:hypothetical protein